MSRRSRSSPVPAWPRRNSPSALRSARSLISEALHSSVDVVATVITWLVVRVSDQPADEEHHYGHGKFESLSALFVIALLYVLAGGILVRSWSRLREGAPPTLSAIPSWCW